MRSSPRTRPTTPPSRDGNWAYTFFADGWRDDMPWVVLRQRLCAPHRLPRALRAMRDGWAFDMFTYDVLHAPTFGVYASPADEARIVRAIRASPTLAATRFAQFERPFYEQVGCAQDTIDQLARQAAGPLTANDVPAPVLIVASPPRSRSLQLLGTPITLDIVIETLVAHPDIVVDDAMALSILLTCHGKPTGVPMPDGAPGLRERPAKSAFMQPFHPKRFKQVTAALRARTGEDSPLARRAEFLQLLAEHLPRTIESLRRRPPRPGHTVHAVARSRLAESVSASLQLERPRGRVATLRTPWWSKLTILPADLRRRFFRSLTPRERAVLRAVQRGTSLATGPSTRRVLLSRAKGKLRKLLAPSRA